MRLDSRDALSSVYAKPTRMIRDKALPRLDKHSRHFIALSPFFCLGSSAADGTGDVSPRGGEPGFVQVLDDTQIAFPDRPGNNRLDTLTNMVENPKVGMLFFLPGVEEMLRLNGSATITTEEALMQRFVHDGKRPRSVIVIAIQDVYFHCSKALKRSALWNPEKHVPPGGFPTLGQIARDQSGFPLPSRLIDMALRHDAKKNLY